MTAEKRSKAGAYAWSRHMESLRPYLLPVIAPSILLPPFLFAFVFSNKMSPEASWPIVFAIVGLGWGASKLADRRDERHWEEGARAEFLVGTELEKLHKDGFHVFHDWLPEDRGNVDHFVVGPQGVFAIETKGWTGEITCEAGKLLKNGRSLIGKDPIKQVKGEAKDVSRLILEARSFQTFVNPILCFSQADLRCYSVVDGVEVTDVGSLRRIIASGPVRNAPQRVRSISYFLEKHLGVGPAAKPGLPPEEPGRLKKLFRLDRVFVALYIAYWLILSVIFARATAQLFEGLAGLYRAFEALWQYLF